VRYHVANGSAMSSEKILRQSGNGGIFDRSDIHGGNSRRILLALELLLDRFGGFFIGGNNE